MITLREVSARELVSKVYEWFQQSRPDISIALYLPDEKLILYMDPELIEQLLKKLLDHAVSRHGDVTHVDLELIAAESDALFIVSDNGSVSEDDLIDEWVSAVSVHGGMMSRWENGKVGSSICFILPRVWHDSKEPQ